MRSGRYFIVIIAFLGILLLNGVSAEIIMTQPSSVYNIGDQFDMNLLVSKQADTNDFLEVKIICDSEQVELYKSPLSEKAGEIRNITLTAKLDRSLIDSVDGLCRIESTYAGDTFKSSNFEISDKINLDINVKNTVVDPGQQISITGIAKKENGKNVNGFIEIMLVGTNVSIMSGVTANQINFNFTIPEDTPTGNFPLRIQVYEKENSGELTNQGSVSTYIKIKQIIKKIDLALNSPLANPGENFSYTLLLYDQSGEKVESPVNSIIYNSNGEIYSRRIVNSFESVLVTLPKNASSGFWSVEAFTGSLTVERQIEIREVKKASFSFVNETLMVENVGNVIYDKPIEVKIGKESILQDLNIEVGKVKKYLIKAPEGDYNIEVITGNESYSFGLNKISASEGFGLLSALTGAAIGLEDGDSFDRGSNLNLLLWLLIILFLMAALLYYYSKVRKNKFYGKIPPLSSLRYEKSPSSYVQLNEDIQRQKEKKKTEKDNFYSNVTYSEKPATHTTSFDVLKFETYEPNFSVKGSNNSSLNFAKSDGKKESVIVIALKIKNVEKLLSAESSAFLTIEQALRKARQAKAKVYDQGAFKLMVFSQSLSPNVNEKEAIRVAKEIDNSLKDFNKKYAIKIEYGIGGNTGDMLYENLEGKAKFTSIGNTIVLAKNAAEKANSELVVSQQLFRKVYSIVKSEPTENGMYRIFSFLDRSQHSAFIQRFMKK